VFVRLIKGIQYIHTKNVVHRDLKLENLLLQNKDDITSIKIADFGLAKRAMNGYMETVCGTPQYVAPEVIKPVPGVVYGPECDLWSAGVVLFTILAGYPPFYNENTPALFRQIRKGAFNFDDPVWDEVSDDAKDLIQKLLTVSPQDRITSEGCLQHKWCRSVANRTKLLSGTQKNLKIHFRTKMKGAINSVIAANKLAKMSVQ
jgi:serine/threonine protein kinase